MVDERCKRVHQQDGQHHALGVTTVVNTNQDGEHANEQAVDVLAHIGACTGDGVGCHEHGAKGEAAQAQLCAGIEHRGGVGGTGQCVNQCCHAQAANEYRAHDAPRGDAREQQDGGTDEDGDHRGLAGRAGDEADEGVHGRDGLAQDIGHAQAVAHVGGYLAQRRGTREGVNHCALAHAEGAVDLDKRLVAAHARRIGEEEERAGDEGNVEDVHARAAENLLGKYHGKRCGDGGHPQRGVNGDDEGNQDTRYQESLLDLLVMNLCADELDAQTHGVTHHNHRQQGQQTVEEHGEPARGRLTDGQVVLVADVVHAEQQCRYQGGNHGDHGALEVIAVVDVDARLRCCVGREQEGLHAVIDRLQLGQLAAGTERGLNLVHEIP